MAWPNPIILQSDRVTLMPLTQVHCADLQEAVKDGELWKLLYTVVPTPEAMAEEIQRRLDCQKQGSMLPFAVIDNHLKQAVGMTTYCQLDAANRRLDIGWTWYRKASQRTWLNTECKLLLLTHAFEALNCIAVGFRVHILNQPSRNAVERLGAKLDGIMRNYSIMPNGTLRDMCMYSILPQEWPEVKQNLTRKLERL